MLQRLVSLAATEGRNEELELSFSVFAVYVSHPITPPHWAAAQQNCIWVHPFPESCWCRNAPSCGISAVTAAGDGSGRGGAGRSRASHTETFMTDKYDTKYILLTCNWIWTLLIALVSHLDTDHPIWSANRMKAGAVSVALHPCQ